MSWRRRNLFNPADKVSRLSIRNGSSRAAILTINERSLAGVVAALRARGLRIPEDISVLAVTSTRNATVINPQISAADVPAAEMGRAAVAAVLKRMTPTEEPLPNLLLAPPFVDRHSVAAPPNRN